MKLELDAAVSEKFGSIQKKALIAGGVASVLVLVGLVIDPQRSFQSYMFGYLLWFGLTIGCIPLAMLHYLFGGAWGAVILRPVEAGMRLLAYMALLFVPVLLGFGYIFVWANHEVLANHQTLEHFVHLKTAYLNVPFFIGRAVIYFAVWGAIAYFLNKWSTDLDRTADPGRYVRLNRLSAIGMVLFVLTVTFAAFDWVMSLNPTWFSGIFGVLFGIGRILATLCLTVVFLASFSKREPFSEFMNRKMFGDLGGIMLAMVMIWAYFNLSQLIIIWSANLPEETPYYITRVTGGWRVVSWLLGIFHFFVPFCLLLSATLRYNSRILSKIAILLLVMHVIELYWLVIPSFQITPEFGRAESAFYWLDVVAPVAIGGFWIYLFLWQLKGRALAPLNDPYMVEVHEHA